MFSMAGLVLQLGYLLLVAAMLAGKARIMRLLVAAAGIVLLLRSTLLVHDRATIVWMAILLAAWALKLWSDRRENAKTRFTDREELMRSGCLSDLSHGAARLFIDQGLWIEGSAGEILTHEGRPVEHVYFLASGQARVTSNGRLVGTCRAGDLIGEATILSGDDATATVTLASDATFWCASTTDVRQFLDDHDGLRIAIERSFSRALKEKLRAANRMIAESAVAA